MRAARSNLRSRLLSNPPPHLSLLTSHLSPLTLTLILPEGAGQQLLSSSGGTDLSGNAKLAEIGPWLKDRVAGYMAEQGTPASIKYIDPT